MGVLKPLSGDPMEKLSAELVVDTHIKVGNPGLFVPVKILIDSGSRVPILFRRNLFQNLTPARRPIKMCTATNSPLPGGSMGAVVSMALPIAFPEEGGDLKEKKFRVSDWGYEGAIGGGGVDIIVGYPVLVRYGIAILPRLDCLALDNPHNCRITVRPAGITNFQTAQVCEVPVIVPSSSSLRQSVRRHEDRQREQTRLAPVTATPKTLPPPPPPTPPSQGYKSTPEKSTLPPRRKEGRGTRKRAPPPACQTQDPPPPPTPTPPPQVRKPGSQKETPPPPRPKPGARLPQPLRPEVASPTNSHNKKPSPSTDWMTPNLWNTLGGASPLVEWASLLVNNVRRKKAKRFRPWVNRPGKKGKNPQESPAEGPKEERGVVPEKNVCVTPDTPPSAPKRPSDKVRHDSALSPERSNPSPILVSMLMLGCSVCLTLACLRLTIPPSPPPCMQMPVSEEDLDACVKTPPLKSHPPLWRASRYPPPGKIGRVKIL